MLERLADVIDTASIHEAKTTEHSVKYVQSLLAPQSHPDFDGEHCLECGDDLPEVRLTAGRIRCVMCQAALERRLKSFIFN